MSEWERKKYRMWVVTLLLWVVTLAIAIFFALDYRIGKDEALLKMDKGIENSGKLVTIAEGGIKKIETLEERCDRLEIELRKSTARLETYLTAFNERSGRMEAVLTEFVAWARNPFASLLERKPKEARR